MTPVVGYPGGKRRLLPRLRKFLDPSIHVYIEPFVGMGAAYLDICARGFKGVAILADNNPAIVDFWKIVHTQINSLVTACGDLPYHPTTPDYFAIMQTREDDPIKRTANFLWLTNYAFGNQAPTYTGECWVGKGTKLTSSEKWGKTFPWIKCVDRLSKLVGNVRQAQVYNDCRPALDQTWNGTIFADPPYFGKYSYKGAANESIDYVPIIAAAKANTTVLSESRDLRSVLPEWQAESGMVTARQSNKVGATNKRTEWIYYKTNQGLDHAPTREEA